MLDILREFYSDTGPERVGFILADTSIVEVENVFYEPENGFDVAAEDLITFGERAVASWHTHPGRGVTKTLSSDDMLSFMAWPDLDHFIIASDGIAAYRVIDGSLVQQSLGGSYAEAPDNASRAIEEAGA